MDPIGFYIDCDTATCPDHLPDPWEGFEDWSEPIPIFFDSEGDTPTHCTVCHELIPHALTDDGVCYMVDAVTDRDRIMGKGVWRLEHPDPDPDPLAVLSAWADRLEDYGRRDAADIGHRLIALAYQLERT